MYHIAGGAMIDFNQAGEEFKRRGIPMDRLQASIAGGNDSILAEDPATGRPMPTAQLRTAQIAVALKEMGVNMSNPAVDIGHSRGDDSDPRWNVGLDLNTGELFYFSDPSKRVPYGQQARNELQDNVADFYVVRDNHQ